MRTSLPSPYMRAALYRFLEELPDVEGGLGRTEHSLETHEVLAGRADRVRGCGIDRWWGGIHLAGHEIPWRWDRQARRVVQT